VRNREGEESSLGKIGALARVIGPTVRQTKLSRVAVTVDGATERAATFLLFVGNNPYELDLLHVGRRASIDGGVLSLSILTEGRPLRLAAHVLRALAGGPPRPGLFRSRTAREITVVPDGVRAIDVACDGEVRPLTVPLVYRILPRALRVVVPHGANESSRATPHDKTT